MAQVEFTGKDMTVSVAGGTTLDGVTKVTINEDGGPDVEQLDATVSGDSVYTYLADPLGSKGNPKATVTITVQDSTVRYTDNKATKLLAAGRRGGICGEDHDGRQHVQSRRYGADQAHAQDHVGQPHCDVRPGVRGEHAGHVGDV